MTGDTPSRRTCLECTEQYRRWKHEQARSGPVGTIEPVVIQGGQAGWDHHRQTMHPEDEYNLHICDTERNDPDD